MAENRFNLRKEDERILQENGNTGPAVGMEICVNNRTASMTVRSQCVHDTSNTTHRTTTPQNTVHILHYDT